MRGRRRGRGDGGRGKHNAAGERKGADGERLISGGRSDGCPA